MFLIDEINAALPTVFRVLNEEVAFQMGAGGGVTATAIGDVEVQRYLARRSEFKELRGDLGYIGIVLDLINCQVFRSKVVTEHILQCLAGLLDACEISFFESVVLLIAESISGNPKVVLNMALPILQFLLPALISKLQSESADIRFLSLKIFTDIIVQYFQLENKEQNRLVSASAATPRV